MSDYKLITVKQEWRVQTITLNRPEKRNALNLELCEELADAFDRADRGGVVGAVVLNANGPAFCSGMDLRESPDIDQIRLVAGLRWRLMRNNMRKKNNRMDLIGLIFAGLFGSILVIGLCFAFYLGAYTFLSTGKAGWIALLFWAIFLWWQLFPIFVAGFGANFAFRPLCPCVGRSGR